MGARAVVPIGDTKQGTSFVGAKLNEYASRARSEIELAQALGSSCSFRAERWNSNLVQHMNWCNRTDTRAHELEDAARRKELAECKAIPPK
jgi:hypothetical protein